MRRARGFPCQCATPEMRVLGTRVDGLPAVSRKERSRRCGSGDRGAAVLRPDQATESPCGPRAEQHLREKTWRKPAVPHNLSDGLGVEKERMAQEKACLSQDGRSATLRTAITRGDGRGIGEARIRSELPAPRFQGVICQRPIARTSLARGRRPTRSRRAFHHDGAVQSIAQAITKDVALCARRSVSVGTLPRRTRSTPPGSSRSVARR
jgi:hypothetical protein